MGLLEANSDAPLISRSAEQERSFGREQNHYLTRQDDGKKAMKAWLVSCGSGEEQLRGQTGGRRETPWVQLGIFMRWIRRFEQDSE